ncbi:hypothetical protein [Alkaliphilus crotonatoxidans]
MKLFKLKELIFVTLTVALMFVAAYMLIPIMGILPLPAYRALLVAPVYGGGVLLVANYTKKFGTVTIIGIILGVILSVFSVLMLLVSIVSGLLTDLLWGLILGGYKHQRNCLMAAGFFPAIQIPMVFYMMAYTLGGAMADLLAKPLIIIIPTLITFGIGFWAAKGVLRAMLKRRLKAQF